MFYCDFLYFQLNGEKCDACLNGVQTLFKHFRQEVVPLELDYLTQEICTTAEDSEGCQSGILTWWPTLAGLIFSDDVPKIFCPILTAESCSNSQNTR